MAYGIWRGVDNVARKVIKEWRGVGNVARNIKAEWRGVDGVARKVFQSELVLYDNGVSNFGLLRGGSGVTIGADCITITSTQVGFYFSTPIDLTKFTHINIDFTDGTGNTVTYPNGCWYLTDRNHSTGFSTSAKFDEEGYARSASTRMTSSWNYQNADHPNNIVNMANVVLAIHVLAWKSDWLTSGTVNNLKIHKIWLS